MPEESFGWAQDLEHSVPEPVVVLRQQEVIDKLEKMSWQEPAEPALLERQQAEQALLERQAEPAR